MILVLIIIIFFNRTDCIEKKDSPEVYFCCCEGNMCNEKFSYFPEMEVTQRKCIVKNTCLFCWHIEKKICLCCWSNLLLLSSIVSPTPRSDSRLTTSDRIVDQIWTISSSLFHSHFKSCYTEATLLQHLAVLLGTTYVNCRDCHLCILGV